MEGRLQTIDQTRGEPPEPLDPEGSAQPDEPAVRERHQLPPPHIPAHPGTRALRRAAAMAEPIQATRWKRLGGSPRAPSMSSAMITMKRREEVCGSMDLVLLAT